MKKELATLIVLLLFSPPLTLAQQEQSSQPGTFAFTHVTVIDVAARDARRASKSDQTVVVVGNRVVAVGRNIRIPEGARVIDASGKYLIPGLWDMHAHLLSHNKRDSFFPLYVVNGVTAVRDMNSLLPMREINQWRREIAAGTLVGPRLAAVAGPLIAGPGTRQPAEQRVSSESEARRAVIARKEMGVDFIKVGSNIPRPVYLAIADESRRQRLTLVGHVPGTSVAEALEAGQRGIEHAGRLLQASSPLEGELADERLGIRQTEVPFMLEGLRLSARARRTYSEGRVRTLAGRFRSKGAWLVPTLVQGYAWPYVRNGDIPYRDWLKYMPQTFTRAWKAGGAQFGQPTEGDFLDAQANFEKTIEIVGVMHGAGVGIMAGTDASGGFIGLIPGISLHYELVLLVKAGLTPLEALRAATLNPARFLGQEKELGTVERGKLADLVLLDADPLGQITNTQKIAAVIVNGRYLPKEELRKMLSRLEATANEK
jgi:hypothetical protein